MNIYIRIRNFKRSDGTSYKRVGKCKSETRTLTAKARAYMRFLIIACFVIIGPDRQEVYRELRLGKSLKYGLFSNRNQFVEADQLDDISQAKLYIDPDYKTKKKTWKNDSRNP